jgi:Zn-dependent protease with chaperone function
LVQVAYLREYLADDGAIKLADTRCQRGQQLARQDRYVGENPMEMALADDEHFTIRVAGDGGSAWTMIKQ